MFENVNTTVNIFFYIVVLFVYIHSNILKIKSTKLSPILKHRNRQEFSDVSDRYNYDSRKEKYEQIEFVTIFCAWKITKTDSRL